MIKQSHDQISGKLNAIFFLFSVCMNQGAVAVD